MKHAAMRIGLGMDVHAFGPGNEIILGGVRIPHVRALRAHSDGDVLVHALCDALLGGAGLGDIGQHYPDTDSRYRAIDSRKLLHSVLQKIHAQGLWPVNMDATLIAQVPRLDVYISPMRVNLSNDLGLSAEYVNIKATTTEGLGFIGREEGIAAQVVVLLSAT